MTNRNLENITIHQFRGLKELELKDLGQINLLVGVNNSGKTSVLEALSIYCDPLDLKVWLSVARKRDEFFSSSRTPPLEALKWLFDKDTPQTGTIVVSGDGKFVSEEMKAVYEETEEIVLAKVTQRMFFMNDQMGEDEDSVSEDEDDVKVRKGLQLKIKIHDFRAEPPDMYEDYQLWENDSSWAKKTTQRKNKFPVSMVTPTSHRSYIGQIRLLSQARFDGFKSEVLDLFNQMDQNITDVEILSPPSSTSSNVNIYIQHKKLGLVPLSSFGDGVRRLLHIALKLASVRGGILLIDELESTIHTEALQSSFEWLVKWSKAMDVQIFATTHSLETVDALLAVNKSASDLVLYRLEKKETQTKVVRHDWSRLKRLRENLGMEVR
jgi:predicted ATP-dependent endonuclease of OLD family